MNVTSTLIATHCQPSSCIQLESRSCWQLLLLTPAAIVALLMRAFNSCVACRSMYYRLVFVEVAHTRLWTNILLGFKANLKSTILWEPFHCPEFRYLARFKVLVTVVLNNIDKYVQSRVQAGPHSGLFYHLHRVLSIECHDFRIQGERV